MMYKRSLCRLGAFLSRGFTLVEAIIVLVVLAIASVTIATLTGNIFNSQDNNKDLQVGTELMQACAEQVLATRRLSGYTIEPNCSTLPLPSGFTNLVASGPSGYTCPSGTTNCACPSGTASCRLVTISVSTSSGPMGSVKLLLVGP